MFYFLLLCCPFLAWMVPEVGEYAPDFIYALCIAGIFLLAGLRVDRTEFSDSQKHIKVGLAIQVGSFLLMPLLALVLVHSLFPLLNIPSRYAIGALFTMMLPVTTTSCSTFCEMAKVPSLDAVMNAILGNVAGMLALPIIVPYLLLDVDAGKYEAIGGAVVQIGGLVLIPLILGVFLGRSSFYQKNFAPSPLILREISQALLLWIIYRSYCKSFYIMHSDEQLSLYPLFFGMLILHLVGNVTSVLMGKWLGFDKDTRYVFLFTIPQKTIVLGLPLAVALAGGDKRLWLSIVMPLLLYNNVQYIVAGTIAWMKGRTNSVL